MVAEASIDSNLYDSLQKIKKGIKNSERTKDLSFLSVEGVMSPKNKRNTSVNISAKKLKGIKP